VNTTVLKYSFYLFAFLLCIGNDFTALAEEIKSVWTDPLPISVKVTGKLALCSHSEKGSILLEINGGTAPYSYRWNTLETTKNRVNLNAGSYTVEITDAGGEKHVEHIIIQPPYPLILESLIKKDASCGSSGDGFAKLSVKVGRGEPYKISWSNGLKNVWEADNLVPGVYSVVVADTYNCEVTSTFEIKSAIEGINVAETIQNVTCSNPTSGAILLAVSGGSGTFKFQWSNGATSKDILSVPAGSYSVLITDGSGCTYEVSYTLQEIAPLELAFEVEDETCLEAGNGKVQPKVTGGKAPYSYLWSTGQTDEKLSSVKSGTYSLKVTDAFGCVVSGDYSVTSASTLTVELVKTSNPDCANSSGGMIALEVGGASGTYDVIWSDGIEGLFRDGLKEGIYQVKVRDESGCEINKSFSVTQAPQLSARIETMLDVDCDLGSVTGVAWVSIQGGNEPYTIKWNTGYTDQREINYFQSGNIEVEVTDASGCSSVSEVRVEFPSQFSASGRLDFKYRKLEISSNPEVQVEEQILFESIISEEFIAWEWSFGDGKTTSEKDPIHVFAKSGEFEVTLMAFDSYGCSVTERNIVQVNGVVEVVTIPTAFSPNGDGLNDTFFPKFNTPTFYTMEIFNTWGEKIFASTGAENHGWDGFFRGQISPASNYLYQLTYTTLEGEVIFRSGGVTLIR